jgi:hypothetical protein
MPTIQLHTLQTQFLSSFVWNMIGCTLLFASQYVQWNREHCVSGFGTDFVGWKFLYYTKNKMPSNKDTVQKVWNAIRKETPIWS